jgi:hypothetical protein
MSDTLEAQAVTASTETVGTAPAPNPAPLSVTAAALEACIKAYRAEYAAQKARGKHDCDCVKPAGVAYRRALPTPETLADIQAFIACIAQGINYQVYEGRESTQLLYAAQVALVAQRPKPEPKPEKG